MSKFSITIYSLISSYNFFTFIIIKYIPYIIKINSIVLFNNCLMTDIIVTKTLIKLYRSYNIVFLYLQIINPSFIYLTISYDDP